MANNCANILVAYVRKNKNNNAINDYHKFIYRNFLYMYSALTFSSNVNDFNLGNCQI